MESETEAVTPAVESEATASPQGTFETPPAAEAVDRAEALARDLRDEKEFRQDERFLFLVAIIILLDVIVFDAVGGWIAPVALVILELAFLVVLARLMGVEEVVDLAKRLGRWTMHVVDGTVRAVQSLTKSKMKTE